MGFARFGIKHLSPSALNCWRSTPGMWALRYLANVRDDGNAAIWRGNAVERGCELLLRGEVLDGAIAGAMQTFEAAALGEIAKDIDEERARIPGMVRQCANWYGSFDGALLAPLAASQLKVETWLDGVSIPVIGYVDFTFMEGPDIDCKSTKACPSAPRPDHVRQIALYWRARQRPGALLYVTDKKHAYFCPPESDLHDAINDLADTARSLERFLSVMPDVNTAVRSLPFDRDHFSWSSAAQAKVAELAEAF